MIEARNVSKKIGSHYAVKDASFLIRSGERAAFLGRSGAGKTTLMNILTGYTFASDGSVSVNGIDMLKYPVKAKGMIGYLPKNAPLYPYMTAEEYLLFACEIRRVPKAVRAMNIALAIEHLSLHNKRGRLIKNMSKADRQRVAIAGMLCADPLVLILDEPTAGLEPDDVAQLRLVLRNIQKTMVVATSNIQEVTALCSRVYIMHEGSIVAHDAIENFTQTAGGRKRISVRLAAGRSTGLELLKNIDGVDLVECTGSKEPGTYDYIVDSTADLRSDIFRSAAKAGIVLLGLKPMSVTLEDVFYQLTCGG